MSTTRVPWVGGSSRARSGIRFDDENGVRTRVPRYSPAESVRLSCTYVNGSHRPSLRRDRFRANRRRLPLPTFQTRGGGFDDDLSTPQDEALDTDDFLARLFAIGEDDTKPTMPEPLEGESEEEFGRRFLAHLKAL